MLHSMTGFGAAVCKEENILVSVELKTVNNRYFKLSLRLTEGYGALEQRIESFLRKVIERGTISAHIRIITARENSGYQINKKALKSYTEQVFTAVQELNEHHNFLIRTFIRIFSMPAIQISTLATLPGVIVMDNEHDEAASEKVWTLLEKTLREALDALQTMRKAEGDAMEKGLAANVESLRQLIDNIAELSPRVAPVYRQKLQERIEKVLKEQGLELNDADFTRELAVYADRCDISEELVRFQSHLEQFVSAMQSPESCGRKLDFLTQELFREVNTIGSKANDADITKHVVEIKTIIERIREMVQNVE